MMRAFPLAVLAALTLAGCNQSQINASAALGCELALTEAENYADKSQAAAAAYAALSAACANPSATATLINDLRKAVKKAAST